MEIITNVKNGWTWFCGQMETLRLRVGTWAIIKWCRISRRLYWRLDWCDWCAKEEAIARFFPKAWEIWTKPHPVPENPFCMSDEEIEKLVSSLKLIVVDDTEGNQEN